MSRNEDVDPGSRMSRRAVDIRDERLKGFSKEVEGYLSSEQGVLSLDIRPCGRNRWNPTEKRQVNKEGTFAGHT